MVGEKKEKQKELSWSIRMQMSPGIGPIVNYFQSQVNPTTSEMCDGRTGNKLVLREEKISRHCALD